jgi:hypothetical protein
VFQQRGLSVPDFLLLLTFTYYSTPLHLTTTTAPSVPCLTLLLQLAAPAAE